MNDFISFQNARLRRIQKMSFMQFLNKLQEKIIWFFSVRNNVRRLAFALNRFSIGLFLDNYQERTEIGPVNLEVKLQRQAMGGPFEPPLIVLVNRAATQLIGNTKSILEVGCGTGMFSYFASQDKSRQIVASEFNNGARRWAQENRASENIKYCNLALEDFDIDSFDLAVAIEVIEHLDDFGSFLLKLQRVAPAAIISTPNKNRSAFDSIANTPIFSQHVREWTTGEFYWVLRCFYDDVQLYTLPEQKSQLKAYQSNTDFNPKISKCGLLSTNEVLIAYCQNPKRYI